MFEFLGEIIVKLLSWLKSEGQSLVEQQKQIRANKKSTADTIQQLQVQNHEYEVTIKTLNSRVKQLNEEIAELRRRSRPEPVIERRMVTPRATVNPTLEEAEYYPDILKQFNRDMKGRQSSNQSANAARGKGQQIKSTRETGVMTWEDLKRLIEDND